MEAPIADFVIVDTMFMKEYAKRKYQVVTPIIVILYQLWQVFYLELDCKSYLESDFLYVFAYVLGEEIIDLLIKIKVLSHSSQIFNLLNLPYMTVINAYLLFKVTKLSDQPGLPS